MTEALGAGDHVAIQQLVYRYAWALDTGDVDGFVACFSDDAVLTWDVFEEPDSWTGPDQLRAFATHLRDLPTTAGRQHHVANILVTADGEGARAVSYVAVAMRHGEGPHAITAMGWYEDAFARVAGEWRIRRRVIRDWSGPVLARLAGQSGERVVRPRPPALAGLARVPVGGAE